MAAPVIFGADYSVYTRIARLALEEKKVKYGFEIIDIFSETGFPDGYSERHPFAKIPAFEHEGFRLFETAAITRYVDEAFAGPALIPDSARERARMNQIIGILDAYAYGTWVWDVFVERVRVPQKGGTPDEEKIAEALVRGRKCAEALVGLMSGETYFIGDHVTLADLHAAPMMALFRLAPEGAEILKEFSSLQHWWTAMNARPALAATRPPIERELSG